ncbi:RNA polymerase sigma factor [Bacillaceae bacterium Marseille-Q3522]|nr:RNA polymerase sigma factor [Bacillaceae bacterium Marseille-Q3522]
MKKEQEAKTILFELFYDKIYHTAYYITRDPHISQDIAQETFIKAFQNLHKITDRKKIAAWLGTIATNKSIDYLRKKSRYQVISVENPLLEHLSVIQQVNSPVEKKLEEKYQHKLLKKYLSLLNPEYQQVFILKYDYDLKLKEIAKMLNISESAVKSRYYRARKQLRSLLKNTSEFKGAEQM